MRYDWSNIFNIIIDIKNKYIEKFGNIDYYKTNDDTCIEKWIASINDEEYVKMFAPIQFNQYGDLILVRYGRYSKIFAGETALNYDEFWESYGNIYRECRSIVIDVRNENIVLSPFDKFFNIDENEESSFENVKKRIQNANSIEITDKLDGSMQNARFYQGRIVMSGSQSLDVENSWRLKDGYRMLTENKNYVKALTENKDLTFIFEYISLADSHVVNYTKEDEGLYLIGLRNTKTGRQSSYSEVLSMAKSYSLKSTKIFEGKTIDSIMDELDEKKSNEAEGFVINIDGFMCKIKYNDYTSIHKVLSNISSINLIIKNIADDTYDDLLSKIPNAYRWRVEKIYNIVIDYIKKCDLETKRVYNEVKSMEFKEAMIYLNKNYDGSIKAWVINELKGNSNNYLKSRVGRYTKLKEMGYNESEYGDLFKEID